MSLDALSDVMANALAAADAGDPRALAALLDSLESLREEARIASAEGCRAAVDEAIALVERVLLREEHDPSAALLRSAELLRRSSSAAGPRTRRDPALVHLWIDRSAALRAELAGGLDREDREGEDCFRALAEESLAARLPEAAEICDRAAGDLEHELDPDSRDRSAKAALSWLAEAEAALRSDPDGPLPSTTPDEETAVRHGARALATALRVRPDLAGDAGRRPSAESAHDDPIRLAPVDDAETLSGFLAEAREHLEQVDGAILALDRSTDDPEPVNALFRVFHTIKGVAGFLALVPVVELAHLAEGQLDALRCGKAIWNLDTRARIGAARDALLRLLDQASGGAALSQRDFADYRDRVAGRVESSGAGAGAVTIVAEGTGPRRTDVAVKVATARLDALLDQVGELMVAQLMVAQDPAVVAIDDPRTRGVLGQLARVVRDLQETATGLRMVTLRPLFQRMARLVRELAVRSGKRIELRLEGEDTELDRRIVEELGDPLVHMLRNACDHGIEPPQERIERGKPAVGHLVLAATHRGGMIHIEIADDGRGLQRDRILERGRRIGLFGSARRDEEITDQEAWAAIFRPGFSTADRVTDLSGRGVGMDVVKRNIESLRGTIDIGSEPGRGTRFDIRLPLTTAVIDGTLVRVGRERFVLPTAAIESPLRLAESDLRRLPGGEELVRYRDEWLPLQRLDARLGLAGDEGPSARRLVLILDAGGRRSAVAVDEVVGRQQAVIKGVDGPWVDPAIAGGTILGDGRVALILDVAGLAQTPAGGQRFDRSRHLDGRTAA